MSDLQGYDGINGKRIRHLEKTTGQAHVRHSSGDGLAGVAIKDFRYRTDFGT